MSTRVDAIAGRTAGEARFWRRWLATLLLTVAIAGSVLYVAVVAIDPFSSGRFALTQRVDLAAANVMLAKTGLLRDPRFNAVVIGSSTAVPIDPTEVGGSTGWNVAQAALFAAVPASQLKMASAYDRFHRETPALQIYVLDIMWCSAERLEDAGWGSFPSWLLEDDDIGYLSRILFPEAVSTAARRVGIWLDLSRPRLRPDGYETVFVTWKQGDLGALARPRDGPPPDAPFPRLEALAQHLKQISPQAKVMLVLAPLYAGALPVPESAAARRLDACKQAVRTIAANRVDTALVDLLTDNAISRDPRHYVDQHHYLPTAASLVAAELARAIVREKLTPP